MSLSSAEAAIRHPVERQLAAYNARDIEAFMPCWAEDCAYHAFPATLLASGHAAIRDRHLARFGDPFLAARLVSRGTVGSLVIDQEVVTRRFPEGPGEADVLALYEVAAGRIAKAWFHTSPPRLHPPGTLTILPAMPRDAGAIRALTRAAYAKWVPVIGREPRPMAADHEAAVRQHRIDLLFRDGLLVALIELVPGDDHLLIENLAVDPSAHRQGLGRRLLAHAEAVCAAAGQDDLRLYTNRAFAGNVALYQRAGFAITREEPFLGGTTVFMCKRLRPEASPVPSPSPGRP